MPDSKMEIKILANDSSKTVDKTVEEYDENNDQHKIIYKKVVEVVKDASKNFDLPETQIVICKKKAIEGKIKEFLELELEEKNKNTSHKPTIFVAVDKLDKLTVELFPIEFLDSNIWFRFVPIMGEDSYCFKEGLKNIFEDIAKYNENGFYKYGVSYEYREFSIRTAVNSHLIGNGDHASAVLPFPFHSETESKRKIEKLEILGKLKWKALLVDDYAEKKLKTIDTNNSEKIKNKKEIIEDLLADIGLKKNIEIDVATGVNEAIEKMKEKSYDIVFLDYLLGKKGVKKEIGIDLLEKLKNEQNGLRKGTIDKFWIFPISSFPYAVSGHMEKKGLRYWSDAWFISTSANPVNTPELFKHKLYSFLETQLKMILCVDKLEANNTSKAELYELNIIGLLKELEGELEGSQLQTAAKTMYIKFVELMTNVDKLQKNKDDGNKLAESLIGDDKRTEILARRAFNLIHLIAFGSGFEWEKMWEEYTLIKNLIRNIEAENSKIHDFFDTTTIENYIAQLSGKYQG